MSYSSFIVYNLLKHQPTTKEKVPIKCPKCCLIKWVILCSHLQTIRKNDGKYLCHKCSIDRKKCSENAKKLWKNKEQSSKILSHLKSKKMKKLVSEKNKRLFSDEKWKNEWKNKIDKETISKKSKKIWESKEYREKINKSFSERAKKQWKDPAYREKMAIYRSTSEYKIKMDKLRHSEAFRKRMKKVWSDPIYREKMDAVRLINLEKMNNKPSRQQYILYSILDDLNIDYKPEYKIGPYKVDCMIPIQNHINASLIIEVQGDYWHSLPDRVVQDKSRSTYLKRYTKHDLKYIWEHEFNNKDRIINLINYWLGISYLEEINFSFNDIDIKTIVAKDAELFISKYHYAGRVGRSGLNIGFFLKDKLVATCIYAFSVRKEVALKQGLKYKQVFELTRLAIHPSYQKKNFASFIIGRSISIVKKSRPEIKRLVSFADSTYNHDGCIYKASNWILDGEVKPDYWYSDKDGFVCHKKTLWNKASKMSMLEREYSDKYGYMKVWGMKKKRFIYNLR